MKDSIKTILRVWREYKPFHKQIYLQIVLVTFTQICAVYTSVLISRLLTGLSDKNYTIIYFTLIYVLCTILLQLVLGYIASRNNSFKISIPSVQYMQEKSLASILSLTVEQHTQDHSAIKRDIINRGEGAFGRVRDKIFFDILPSIIFLLVSILTLAYYSKVLGLMSLVSFTILFFWTKKHFKDIHPLLEQDRKNWIEQGKTRVEAFTHLILVKLSASQNYFIKKYIHERQAKIEFHYVMLDKRMSHSFYKNLFVDVSEFLGLFTAVLLFISGHVQIGIIFLVFSLNTRIYSKVTALQSSMRDMPFDILDIKRYLDIIDMKPSFDESGVSPVLNKNIEIENLTFSYSKDSLPVLRNVTLTIEANKKTALVGTSGSGKTTLTKLLMRSHTYSQGSIKITDTEINDIDANYLRKHIGYVEQHVDLFDTSIKDNLLLGVDRVVTEDELQDIVKKARITQFYDRLGELGLDTIIGERGIKLSGGERQRVGIARALIRNPDILIFDEATSALDTENESFIKEAIDEASKGRTTIIIAHRLSTVRDADKIVVMDKGTVVAEGTHEELLENSTHYQTLVAHQLSE